MSRTGSGRAAEPAEALRVVLLTPSTGDLEAADRAFEIAMEGGATALWVRERQVERTKTRDWIAARARRAEARGPRPLAWILSGDPEGARTLGLFAVHLGYSDPAPGVVRRAFAAHGGPAPLIGFSAHDPLDREAVEASDYLTLGPLGPTPKPHASPPPLTLERFERLVGRAGRPVVALGGLDEDLVEPALRAGACGVAVRRAVLEAADPVEALGRLVARVDRVLGGRG